MTSTWWVLIALGEVVVLIYLQIPYWQWYHTALSDAFEMYISNLHKIEGDVKDTLGYGRGEDCSHSSRIDGGIIKVLQVVLAAVVIVILVSGRSHHTARVKCMPTSCSAVPDNHCNLIIVLEALVSEWFYIVFKLEINY